jgi:hypothetical protein
LATPSRAFITDAFPSLARSVQHLIFIGFDNVFFGIDYFSMSSSTTSPTSSLLTQFWNFIPDMRLVLAKLEPHLILDSSDCIVSDIDIPLR